MVQLTKAELENATGGLGWVKTVWRAFKPMPGWFVRSRTKGPATEFQSKNPAGHKSHWGDEGLG